MEALTAHRLNRANAALWVQSLRASRRSSGSTTRLGYKANLVFLVSASGRPYDLEAQGDPRTYTDLLTPTSLRA